MKSVAAALSLHTIGHLKQNEVIGQTPRVRPPPAWRPSEPQRAGKPAGGNVTSWKTPSLRLSRGCVSTRSPAENRSGGTEERPTCGKGGQGGPAELGGGACPSQPCAPASMLRRAPESCPVPGGPVSEPYHVQAGGSREQAAQIHPGWPRVTPTAPGSWLEGAWEPLSGTCPTHVPSLLSWHTYYWLHARLQAGYAIFLI